VNNFEFLADWLFIHIWSNVNSDEWLKSGALLNKLLQLFEEDLVDMKDSLSEIFWIKIYRLSNLFRDNMPLEKEELSIHLHHCKKCTTYLANVFEEFCLL
jgi:hypothetical protein